MPSSSDARPALVARPRVEAVPAAAQPRRSLKDRVLAVARSPRGASTSRTFWALRDVSFDGAAAAKRIGARRPQRVGQEHVPQARRRHHGAAPAATCFVRPARAIGTMIELGVGFHRRADGGRRTCYLNASIYGLARAEIDEIYPRDRRVLGPRQLHGRAAEELLVRHVHAARLRGGRQPRARHPAARRGVRRRRRRLPASAAWRRCSESAQRGCTVLFVSHADGGGARRLQRVVVLEAGRARVRRRRRRGPRRAHAPDGARSGATALPGAPSRPAPDERPDDRPHRAGHGRRTGRELGPWAADFLRRQGLEPSTIFLDLGCGSLPVALHVLPFMAPSHYWGIDGGPRLFDAGVRVELRQRGLRAERGHFVINPRLRSERVSAPRSTTRWRIRSPIACTPDDFGAAWSATAVGHLDAGRRLFVARARRPRRPSDAI